MLQCVAACCSVLQRVAAHRNDPNRSHPRVDSVVCCWFLRIQPYDEISQKSASHSFSIANWKKNGGKFKSQRYSHPLWQIGGGDEEMTKKFKSQQLQGILYRLYSKLSTCNTLQHIATRCNTLQHTATRCNTLQHAATHCNTLQHAATRCNTLQRTYLSEDNCRRILYGKLNILLTLKLGGKIKNSQKISKVRATRHPL